MKWFVRATSSEEKNKWNAIASQMSVYHTMQ